MADTGTAEPPEVTDEQAAETCRHDWCSSPTWPSRNYSCDPAEFPPDCCHSCAFWLSLAAGDQRGAVVAVRAVAWENPPRGPERFSFDPDKPIRTTGGMRGFGGHRWLIRFTDGREVTTNDLWHNGTIPAEFLDLFPVNAELLDAPRPVPDGS